MKKTLQKTVRINLGLFILMLLTLTSSAIFAAAPTISGAYMSGMQNNSTKGFYTLSVNTGLKQTAVVIYYGTNSNLSGAQRIDLNIYPSNTLTSLNNEILNLLPGTTYYYRFTATNADGVAYSPSASGTGNFRTSTPAPIISAETVTNIANTTATFNYSINPGGVYTVSWLQIATSSNFTTGLVETALAGISGNTASSLSQNLTGLTQGTTYYVRIKANNGTEVVSTGTSFKTLGEAPIPAPVITGLSASNVTDNSAKIDFTVNPNNASTSLEIQYATTSDFVTGRVNKVLSSVSGSANVAVTGNLTGLTQNTTYYVRIKANNGTSLESTPATFTTLLTVVVPTVNNISASSITPNSAIINFSVQPGNSTTQLSVQYTTNSTFLTGVQTVNLADASGNVSVAKSQQISALTPNTKYYYRIDATNSKGTYLSGNSTNFTTLAPPDPELIAEFKFNNSRTSENGSLSFQVASTSFVEDRNGNANNAIALNNTSSSVTIPNLPAYNSYRSIAIWVKLNAFETDGYNQFFSYGAEDTGLSFGGSINETKARVIGYITNAEFTTTNSLDTWYHYVFIYDGTNSIIYKNGALLGSQAKVLNTITDNSFYIGKGVGNELAFNGALDELKIYNYMLTASQISDLYTTGSFTSSLFNPKKNEVNVNLFPNPVHDVLNVETALDIRSVDIYNMQGQKVLTSNQKQVNVAALAAGVYVVKVQDMENKVATLKISVK